MAIYSKGSLRAMTASMYGSAVQPKPEQGSLGRLGQAMSSDASLRSFIH
jgi:hypothetical protein